MIVSINKVVKIHYQGFITATNELFDSSLEIKPLTFLVGHKQMIPGFEEEIMGAEKGERRTFTLTPERAYGPRMEEAVQTIPKDMFGDIVPEVGMTLMSDVGPFNVASVVGDTITVDFNHKLAGQSLTFSVKVVDVRPADEEEISHGHPHGPGGVNH